MSSNFDLKLNRGGVRKMLRSDEMMGLLEEIAQPIADRCGEDYSVKVRRGDTRINAMILTDSAHAHNSNLKHNTIMKALKG